MSFNKIGIITNEKKDESRFYTKNLMSYLSAKSGVAVYTEENCDLYSVCDLLIILGGDGTILKAAAKAAAGNIPMIGLNLGRIGYMSEIETDEISLLDKLFSGDYKIQNRMMIDIYIIKAGEASYAGAALNDAVVTHGSVAELIEIDLACDGVGVTKYRADGVIAATPTGSTAYSMSAGGPIIDPGVECFCVTPICPHSLVNRPLIFSHGSVLEITNKNKKAGVYLTIDGKINIKLAAGDIVRLKKSEYSAKLITIKQHGFFDVVRAKISEKLY